MQSPGLKKLSEFEVKDADGDVFKARLYAEYGDGRTLNPLEDDDLILDQFVELEDGRRLSIDDEGNLSLPDGSRFWRV